MVGWSLIFEPFETMRVYYESRAKTFMKYFIHVKKSLLVDIESSFLRASIAPPILSTALLRYTSPEYLHTVTTGMIKSDATISSTK